MPQISAEIPSKAAGSVCPKLPQLGTIEGKDAAGTPNRSSSSASQSPEWMFISWVREAFEASVM